jgi:hypothetical protein
VRDVIKGDMNAHGISVGTANRSYYPGGTRHDR